MDVPPTFHVGLPQSFGWLIRRSLGDPPVEIAGLDGQWVELAGAPLPVDLVVRIDRSEDGRFVLTGLLIGLRRRREITWQTLRRIKPASILGLIFSGFDPRDPLSQYVETDPAPPQFVRSADFDVEAWLADSGDNDPIIDLKGQAWRRHTRAMTALELWRGAGENTSAEVQVEPVTKPRASVATDLAEFAEIYLRNRAASPHRATTATAREMHISRATALRRITECRQAGLLPPKGHA